MQMSIMFFLPNILLYRVSCFLCRHADLGAMGRRGVAADAFFARRTLDHAERSSITDLHYDAAAMFVLMLVAMTIAVNAIPPHARLDHRRVRMLNLT